VLVQDRSEGWRLIRQHDHAVASGELAHAWRGPGGGEALSFELVLATALHDIAWQELDGEPWFPAAGSRPHDFLDHPHDPKIRAYGRGIGRAAEIHPYAGYLGSLHYTSFPGMERLEAFQVRERKRRGVLARTFDLPPEESPSVQRDLAYLRLFDNLSLFLCLTPPSACGASRPGWLDPESFARSPDGTRFRVEWRGDEDLVLDPFPFREGARVEIPYRDLRRGRLSDGETLRRAWRGAEDAVWRVSLRRP
jgi:hypothetical protein